MTRSGNAFRAILAKDLRVELRTMRSLPAMATFSVTTFVLFHFALNRDRLDPDLAAGVLLATLFFAAILAINRLFVSELEEGGFELIRLAPVDGSTLFAAKAAALFLYLAVLEVIAVPVFAVFFLDDATGLAALAVPLILVNAGLAATGTLVSSMATNSTARDLLIPLILLPLLIPLVIGGAELTRPLLEEGWGGLGDGGKWLAILGLYDAVFILIGYAVFDFLLED
jgi:heme exporter protein B